MINSLGKIPPLFIEWPLYLTIFYYFFNVFFTEPEKKIQCSGTQVPVRITDRAFLISPTYPRILPIWGKHCLWRIKTTVNGTISIYVLDIVGKPDLIIYSYPQSSVVGRRVLTTAMNINISSHLTLDLSLQPFSNVWLSIECKLML